MTTDTAKTIALVRACFANAKPDVDAMYYLCGHFGMDDVTVAELTALLDAAEARLLAEAAMIVLRDERDAARLAAEVARDAAQIMLEALKAALPQAEGCFINHYGDDPWSVEASEPEYIAKMREAIAAAEDALKGRPS